MSKLNFAGKVSKKAKKTGKSRVNTRAMLALGKPVLFLQYVS